MRRTNTRWSNEELERLKTLVASGATPIRASIALKRSKQTVRTKARATGTPFPSMAIEKARRKAILYPAPGSPNDRSWVQGQQTQLQNFDRRLDPFDRQGIQRLLGETTIVLDFVLEVLALAAHWLDRSKEAGAWSALSHR